MRFYNSLLILKILFILLQCLQCPKYTDATCFAKEYKLLPDGFNVFIKNGSQPVFKQQSAKDENRCMHMCVKERLCHIWRFDDNHKCQIFHSMKDVITVEKSKSASMTTYYETVKDEKWHEIYYVKSKSGFVVYPSFMAIGTYESWGPANCTRVFCPDFFRSNLIDVWKKLPVTKVKFSLFKDNAEVIFLIFNGHGTTTQNWFSISRILQSSWKDVHKGAPSIDFGLDYNSARTFYITKHHRGCERESGWMMIAELKKGCSWENHSAYPHIIYSNKTTATIWQEGYATADALVIYMSF